SCDLSILKEHQGFALSCFNIVPRVLLDRDLPIRLRPAIPPLLRKLKSVGERSIPFIKQTVLLEKETYKFDPAFLRCGSTCYLSGYFQNCSYFKHAENYVREAFTFKPGISQSTTELLERISKVNTVSVHVRRGDYLRNSEFRGFFGICGIDYYANACEMMTKISRPALWVFLSDDPQWVRSTLVPRLLQRKLVSEHVVADWNDGAR